LPRRPPLPQMLNKPYAAWSSARSECVPGGGVAARPSYDLRMVARRMTYDEWIQRQRERDPDWDRFVSEFEKVRGPKPKVPLLFDENMEAEVIAELRAVKDFRLNVGKRGSADQSVWNEARRLKAILVTADMDFWEDRKFPLAQSPGVIIVSGGSAQEKVEALAFAVGAWRIVENWRKVPNWLDGTKLKAHKSGLSGKHWDGETVVLI